MEKIVCLVAVFVQEGQFESEAQVVAGGGDQDGAEKEAGEADGMEVHSLLLEGSYPEGQLLVEVVDRGTVVSESGSQMYSC